MKKIVFHTSYHNGDVHVSRGIIRQIIHKLKQIHPQLTFSYAHPNSPELLKDIPELLHEPHLLGHVDHHDNLVQINDTLYINTWYAQQNFKYMNPYGMTFDCLYLALNDSCQKAFGFSLHDISDNLQDFFPIINYSYFQIDQATGWIKAHPNKKVLIENGLALSGQANNIPFKDIIYSNAIKYPHLDFICSHKEEINLPNVFYTQDIINKQGCDLNEISFLSCYCDVIIGRASGVFTFTMTQNNFFERNVKYLCFSNLKPMNKFWLSSHFENQINYSSSFQMNREQDIQKINLMIATELGKL